MAGSENDFQDRSESCDFVLPVAQSKAWEENCLCQLLQTCLETGANECWFDFVRRTRPLIAGVIMKSLRRSLAQANSATVDDLIQDTFLKLCAHNYRILRQFKCGHRNSFYGFLKVISSNVVQDYVRSCLAQKRGAGTAHVSVEHLPIADARSHEKAISQMERQLMLIDAERVLDQCVGPANRCRDRRIFWLYYRAGLSAKEIAKTVTLRLTVKGVESTLCRLSKELRLRLHHR